MIAAVGRLAEGVLAEGEDGLALDRVEFEREAGRWCLRVFLDHPGGVTLKHCEEVARRLGDELDRADVVDRSYSLEVSSPGVERPLRGDEDFRRFAGRDVALHLYRKVDGRKCLVGRLAGLTDDGRVRLELPGGEDVAVPMAEVSRAHLAARWAGSQGREDDGGGLE